MDISSKTGATKPETRINCFSCQHFYITYEPRYPYGCRAAGFKSRALPSIEVQMSSGMLCLLFAAKENAR